MSELEELIKAAYFARQADMLLVSPSAARWLRRWVLSGELTRLQRIGNKKKHKAARRRNRGRGPFARHR